MSIFRRIASVSALAFGLFAAAPVWPASTQILQPDEVAALLEDHQTKADQLKLAGHYAAEAAHLRLEAATHENMAAKQKRSGLPPKLGLRSRGMANHCRNLAKSLRNAARASDELADSYRSMADASEK